MLYTVNPAANTLRNSLADMETWRPANLAAVNQFHAQTGEFRPAVSMRMLYDDHGVAVRFDVRDQYVLARCTEHQTLVCKDSCVEAFLEPIPGKGYLNFEMNCCGTMLLFHISDARRRTDRYFEQYRPVLAEDIDTVHIQTSLKGPIPNEISHPLDWWLVMYAPFSLFTKYCGPITSPRGMTWRGNFFKCADDCSHPHWASWSDIGPEWNFHQPERFDSLFFA